MLDKNELNEYYNKGYLAIKNVFLPHEVGSWKEEVKRLLSLTEVLKKESNFRVYFRDLGGGNEMIERFDPVIDISPILKNLTEDERIVSKVKQVLNCNAIDLFKDKLIFKQPGQGGYPLHQDFSWWHQYLPNEICTVIVAIDNANIQNGAIEFYQNCHHEILIKDGTYRELNEDELRLLDNAVSEVIELNAGDILIFHSLTPHCSSRNVSNTSRSTFYPSYIRGSHKNIYKEHYDRQISTYLKSLAPNDDASAVGNNNN